MPDMFSKEKRSEIMSKIKSKGTKIEVKMIKALEENDVAFEYQPKIFGKPDFLIHPNIALFCDSSFWHGRNWKELKPKLKKEYWQDHISKNIRRDKTVNEKLIQDGYVVLRFWDTQINKDMESCIITIKQAVTSAEN